ncbi:MAG: cobalamin-binding protein [Halobacteria archaeon]
MRIVSLLPSATEMVFLLGLGDRLVGRSAECDFPAEVRRKPVVSRPVVADGPSAEINKAVSGHLHAGRGLYTVDRALLARLRPDLILTQEVCGVCAPTPGTVEAALRGLRHRPEVLSLSPSRLGDIPDDVRRVAEAAGCADLGDRAASALRKRLARVRELLGRVRERPRVFCLEWLDPPFAAGHWIPDMVEAAGGEDLLGLAGQDSRPLSWPDIAELRPEFLVAMPCGLSLERARRELPEAARKASDFWRAIPAVRRGRLFATDGSAYFNRPGPRVCEGVEILAEILHPERARGLAPVGSFEPWRPES